MLGVVRVFSRKSTIILADVNLIMKTIQRITFHESSKTTTRKRSRSVASMMSADHRGITLQQGEETARFDQITLPMRKKRKATPSGPQAQSDALSKSVGSLSKGVLSQLSLPMQDLSLGDSGELDVLAAMETVFPAVLVPRHGVNLPSGLNTPSSGYKSEKQKGMLYSAREQDITLTDPGRQIDFGDYSLFDEDLQFSLHSAELSNAESSRPLCLSQPRDHGAQPRTASPIDPFNVLQEEPLIPLVIEPLQLEPLAIENPRREDALPGTEQEQGAELPFGKKAEKKTPQNSPKVKAKTCVTSSEEEQLPYRTPENDSRERVQPVPPVSTGRKRKFPALRVDAVTELPPSEIRRCLNDTSDIVLDSSENRCSVRRSTRARNDASPFALPGFMASYAMEITDVWKELTLPAFMDPEDLDRSEVPLPGRKRTGRVRVPAKTARPPQTTKTTSNRTPSPVQVLFADEEPIPPIPIQDAPSLNRRDSSVEIERTREPQEGIVHDQLSLPSNSVSGGKSGGHSSSIMQNNLDQVHRLHMATTQFACFAFRPICTQLT